MKKTLTKIVFLILCVSCSNIEQEQRSKNRDISSNFKKLDGNLKSSVLGKKSTIEIFGTIHPDIESVYLSLSLNSTSNLPGCTYPTMGDIGNFYLEKATRYKSYEAEIRNGQYRVKGNIQNNFGICQWEVITASISYIPRGAKTTFPETSPEYSIIFSYDPNDRSQRPFLDQISSISCQKEFEGEYVSRLKCRTDADSTYNNYFGFAEVELGKDYSQQINLFITQ